MKPETARRMLRLVVTTVLLAVLYFWVASHGFLFISYIYLAAGAALALYYMIYNRGFTQKGLTPDMLPDTMTAAEKQAVINDGNRRFTRSRWSLNLLIPILLTFLMDALYLFVFPYFEELFQ